MVKNYLISLCACVCPAPLELRVTDEGRRLRRKKAFLTDSSLTSPSSSPMSTCSGPWSLLPAGWYAHALTQDRKIAHFLPVAAKEFIFALSSFQLPPLIPQLQTYSLAKCSKLLSRLPALSFSLGLTNRANASFLTSSAQLLQSYHVRTVEAREITHSCCLLLLGKE